MTYRQSSTQDVSRPSPEPLEAQSPVIMPAHDTSANLQQTAPSPSIPPSGTPIGAPIRRKPVPKSPSSPKKEHRSNKPDKTLFTASEKIGLLTACYLIVGSICMLGAIGFLWFLWLADFRNSTWRNVADHNWFTRIAAIGALIIRTAASFQSMAATAMISAL